MRGARRACPSWRPSAPWWSAGRGATQPHPDSPKPYSAVRFDPKHWPDSFNKFVSGWGQDKVLWATDYPILPFKECLDEVDELGLDLKIKKKLLRENALRFFKLDD